MAVLRSICATLGFSTVLACNTFGSADPVLTDAGPDGIADAEAGTLVDGIADADAGIVVSDAGAGCDVTQPFGSPRGIDELNTPGLELHPRLSSDELTIYFTSLVANTPTMFQATRRTTADPFGSTQRVAKVPADVAWPTLSRDGRTLVFEQKVDASFEIWFATRTSPLAELGSAAKVANVNAGGAGQPALGAMGLWQSSARGVSGNSDIYFSPMVSGGFAEPARVDALSSSGNDGAPTPSLDEKTIYFASDRSSSKKLDIWMATKKDGSFGVPAAVAELNTDADDVPGWLSDDQCRLYFHRFGAVGSGDIYVATRPR